MSAKHTPGPWSYGSDGTSYVLFADTRCVIATLPGKTNHDAANANLIAAAPDMLDALNLCLLLIGESDMEPFVWATNDHIDEAYRKAKAAIAKAKGGEV